MEGEYPQNRYEMLEALKTAKTVEDFIVIQILISNIFYNTKNIIIFNNNF